MSRERRSLLNDAYQIRSQQGKRSRWTANNDAFVALCCAGYVDNVAQTIQAKTQPVTMREQIDKEISVRGILHEERESRMRAVQTSSARRSSRVLLLTSSQNVLIITDALFGAVAPSSVMRSSTGRSTTRGRRRLFSTSLEFEPCVMPAPSARIFSSSGVAPPVIRAIRSAESRGANGQRAIAQCSLPRRIVRAFSLKYVALIKESSTLMANEVPHANGCVMYNSMFGSSSSS